MHITLLVGVVPTLLEYRLVHVRVFYTITHLAVVLMNRIFSPIWPKSHNLHQVNDANLVVKDSSGNTIEAQFVTIDEVTKNLRQFYTEAYLGKQPKEAPKYWLHFLVSVPPLGWNTYFISKRDNGGIYIRSFISCYRFLMSVLHCFCLCI